LKNLNNLKLKLNTEKPKLEETKKEPVIENSFEVFKLKVLKKIKDDRVLSGLRLKTVVTGTYIIIYQGVKTNILARFTEGRNYIIYRSIIQKRLSDLIEEYYQ